MKMLEVKTIEFRDKKGKCLNCGKETHFYNEDYFCTYDCWKEYKVFKNKEVSK